LLPCCDGEITGLLDGKPEHVKPRTEVRDARRGVGCDGAGGHDRTRQHLCPTAANLHICQAIPKLKILPKNGGSWMVHDEFAKSTWQLPSPSVNLRKITNHHLWGCYAGHRSKCRPQFRSKSTCQEEAFALRRACCYCLPPRCFTHTSPLRNRSANFTHGTVSSKSRPFFA
jgi:hypothetical protein